MTHLTDRRANVKEHFDAYAKDNRWGDLYNPTNLDSYSFLKRRVRVVELLGDLAGKKILDIGCGTGALIEPLIREKIEYEGIDNAPNMIQVAQTHIIELQLSASFKVRVGDVGALPYPGANFDAVVAMGLLEYFDSPDSVIREAMRVAKPGALIIFSIPQKYCVDDIMVRITRPFRTIARCTTGKPPNIERNYYTRKEFKNLFENLGCVVVGERYYNKLILPYPISRLWPRLAYGAAAFVEERLELKYFATGYILACTK